MWLSKQMARRNPAAEAGQVGQISVTGSCPAAVSSRELRDLQVVAPGGLGWSPEDGKSVFVLQEAVLGQMGGCPVELEPGEICLYAGNCSVVMRKNGEIHLNGKIFVNGSEVHFGK